MRAVRNHAVVPQNDTDAIHDLVGLLYEAAVDCRRWGAFLERLVVLTDKSFAALVTREFGVESAAPGLILLRRIPPQSSRFEELYSVLAKHLRRAMELQKRVRDVEAQNAALKVAIDRFSTGLVLLDARMRVVFMNASANMIVSRREGLLLRDGMLTAEDRADAAALSRCFQQALFQHAEGENGGCEKSMLWISRPSGKRPLGVVLCAAQPDGPLSGRSAATMYLSDSESGVLPDKEALRLLYHFTPAETEMTLQLLEGKSLEEGARRLRVSLNTARTHLKRILQKTDTSRQSDLIRLLLSGPASLRL